MREHIYWKHDALYVLDQRLLPFKETYIRCATARDAAKAIKDMAVRGAPLIGLVAAYGVVLGVRETVARRGRVRPGDMERICRRLQETRPTAVNLSWALARMKAVYAGTAGRRRRGRDHAQDRRGDARRGHREQPPPLDVRGGIDRRRRHHPHPLQRRRPCHGRLRHGPGRHQDRP